MCRFFVCLMTMSILLSCSSAQKDYSYMSRKNYQSRSTLTKSLIDPLNPLSEDSIQKILDSKIKIPKRVNLAVTRMNSTNDFQRIDEEVAKSFYDKKNWGQRVQTIIPVPQVLINHPVNITGLRNSAVVLQADMLLLVMPYSQGDWKLSLIHI